MNHKKWLEVWSTEVVYKKTLPKTIRVLSIFDNKDIFQNVMFCRRCGKSHIFKVKLENNCFFYVCRGTKIKAISDKLLKRQG